MAASLAATSLSQAQSKAKPSSGTTANKQKAKASAAKQKARASAKATPGPSAASGKSKKAKAASSKPKPQSSSAKTLSSKPTGKNRLGTKAAAEVDVIDPDEEEEESGDESREDADAEKNAERDEGDERDNGDDRGKGRSRDSSSSPKAPSLELGVQGGILRRDFDYEGRQAPGLRGFELGGAPSLGASLVLFPFASSSSAASMVGLEAGYSTIVGVASEFDGKSFDTSATAYRIQLVLNLPLGKEVSLRPKLGYSGRTLVVAGDTLPNLSEHGPRIGLEGRLATSSFLAELEGGLQYLVSGGELTSSAWFPSASGFGADARARAGLSLADPFQLLVEGGLDYSSFKLNVGANDPHPHGAAESASDVAMSLSLVARLVLR